MDEGNSGQGRIKTADRVLDIIEFIRDEDGARVTEIAEMFDLSKSTVYGYLFTLQDRGYLVKEDDTYYISLQFLSYTQESINRYNGLSTVQNALENLAEATEEVVWFLVEEHGKAVYLENKPGAEAVQTHARIGKQEHLHCIAAGKAILSEKTREEVCDIIEQHGLPARTEQTITDPDELFEELETVREQGYAVNRGETVSQVRAIAVPIRYQNGDVLGALAISGPAKRMEHKQFEEKFADLLLGEAEDVQLRLGWDSPNHRSR